MPGAVLSLCAGVPLTFSVRHHGVAGLAGLAAAHAVHREHAEAVGGERPESRDVEDGLSGRNVNLPALIPRAKRVEYSGIRQQRRSKLSLVNQTESEHLTY